MTDLKAKRIAKTAGADTGIEQRRSICEICSRGCGITAYVKNGEIIKVEGTDAHPVNHGKLCARGLSTRDYVYRADRIRTPLKRVGPRGAGAFKPITWEEAMAEIADGVKNSAYEIILRKRATYFGIAMSVKRICEAIVRDEKSILPVSSLQHGDFGLEHVALSIPAVVGRNGVETTVPIQLSPEETEALRHSAETLRRILVDLPEPEKAPKD